MRELLNLSPEIVCFISELRAAAPPDYRRKKLLAGLRTPDEQAGLRHLSLDLAATDGPPAPVPLVAEDALPRLHGPQRELLDRFVRCVVGRIEERYPLLPGERVEHDAPTLLASELHGFAAGTAVIRRTTNMAVLAYVIGNVAVDGRGHVKRVTRPALAAHRPPDATPGPWSPAGHPGPLWLGGPAPSLGSMVGSAASWVGGQLASGLVSAVGGAIMNGLLEQIFPPGVPSYFDEVYKQMARIVGQEIDAASVASIDSAINGVRQHLANEYRPARDAADLNREADRQLLFELLQKYDSAFLAGPGGMIAALQTERHRLAGFGAFMLGAGVQLALFQEMANVVPQRPRQGEGWLAPLETSYGKPRTGTVATTAQAMAAHLDATWPLVEQARAKLVTTRLYEAHKHVIPGGGDIYWELWGEIVDDGRALAARELQKNDEKNGANPSKAMLAADCEQHKRLVLRQLDTTYNHPREVAALWRQLAEQPLKTAPVSSAAVA